MIRTPVVDAPIRPFFALHIQRSAVPPALNRPSLFLAWLQEQAIELLPRNN
jgi:hypothetical protein